MALSSRPHPVALPESAAFAQAAAFPHRAAEPHVQGHTLHAHERQHDAAAAHHGPDHGHRHGSTRTQLRWVRRIDTLGIWLSALCIVHCALTPVLIVVLPFVGSHEFDETARFGLASLGVVGVGIGAVMHRNFKALPLLVAALTLFGALALIEVMTGEHPPLAVDLGLGVLASMALMGAHAFNTRACRDSEHQCKPGEWFAGKLWADKPSSERTN